MAGTARIIIKRLLATGHQLVRSHHDEKGKSWQHEVQQWAHSRCGTSWEAA
jgi:hypothetical protein